MADKSSAFSAASLLNVSYGGIKKGYLGSYLKDGKKYIPLAFLLVLASAGEAYTFVKLPELFGRLADMFLNVFITSFIKDSPELPVKELILKNASIGVYMLLNALFSYLIGSFSTRITSGSADGLRNRVYGKIRTVKTEYTDIYSKNTVFETATSLIDVQNRSLNIFISQVISAFCLITAVIIKVFSADIVIGIVVAAVIPIQLLVFSVINYAEENRRQRAEIFAPELSELCDSIKEITRAADSGLIMRLTEENEAGKAKEVKLTRVFDAAKHLPSSFFIGVFSAAVIFCGSFRINAGAISIGTVISVIIYLRKLSSPLSQITSFYSSAKQFLWATGEIYSFLSAPDEFDSDGDGPMPQEGGIVFENVSFRYPVGSKYVLRDFSARIPPTGMTVLSGATGAGKSTVVKLILRLYSPSDGTITVNGSDISDIDLKAYRSSFSVIPQDAGLFEGSAEYNVIYPDTEKDEARFNAACECAGIDPEGFFAENGDKPELLTLGQRQQILIARAFYHRARFMIFDEAFSHTDAEAEKKILTALNDCSKTCGVIFISHNNSEADIPGANKIVIDAGEEKEFSLSEGTLPLAEIL